MKYEDYVICMLSSMLSCILSLMYVFWQKAASFEKIESDAYHILIEMYDLSEKLETMFKEENDE